MFKPLMLHPNEKKNRGLVALGSLIRQFENQAHRLSCLQPIVNKTIQGWGPLGFRSEEKRGVAKGWIAYTHITRSD